MELAQTLVRSVARAFCDTRQILIIDAVVLHSALRDDDLAFLMHLNLKDIHKICAGIREERLLHQYVRQEKKPGEEKSRPRTYYYIDYRQTIDMIKWKMHKLSKELQGPVLPASERKEYFCPRCKSEWTLMEVLDSASVRGFLCHKCSSLLVNDPDRKDGGHQQSTRFNQQFQFITNILPQIDSVAFPETTFERAFDAARPVNRPETNKRIETVAVDVRPTAVRGLVDTGPKSMSVSISDSAGPSEAEKAAELARKQKIAEQNALPSWMSSSTVTGESFAAGKDGAAAAAAAAGGLTLPGGGVVVKDEEGTETKDTGLAQASADPQDDAGIDDYFERLKAEQAAEQARLAAESSEEYASEDDDDEDFEDVLAASNDAPVKTEPATVEVEEKPVKKVKVEDAAAGSDESDEDMEFEDV